MDEVEYALVVLSKPLPASPDTPSDSVNIGSVVMKEVKWDPVEESSPSSLPPVSPARASAVMDKVESGTVELFKPGPSSPASPSGSSNGVSVVMDEVK